MVRSPDDVAMRRSIAMPRLKLAMAAAAGGDAAAAGAVAPACGAAAPEPFLFSCDMAVRDYEVGG